MRSHPLLVREEHESKRYAKGNCERKDRSWKEFAPLASRRC
jgi:hypothetical protein